MGNAAAVTTQNFDTEVLKSKEPVLVDFWAAWCGPCRIIAPTVEELATEYSGRLKVVKVDVDENPDVWKAKLRIPDFPSMYVFTRDGKWWHFKSPDKEWSQVTELVRDELKKARP